MDKEKQTNEIIKRIKDFSKSCRKCKHIRLSHLRGKCIATCGTTEKMDICKCKEFVPEDNLDYVEYLAEKRGLI